jgi:hypothetical protein
VLLGNGDGTFQSAVNYDAGDSPWSVAIGDLNGDGTQDLAVANLLSHNVSVLMGNGGGNFQSAVNYRSEEHPRSVAIGDLNEDGAPDLAVANQTDSVSIFINTGFILNPYNGHWYQRFDTTMTWHEAKTHCENLDGHLATINSQAEDEFVYNNLAAFSPHEKVWIGATDETQEGAWEWVTSEVWNFTNWAENEPNNCSDGEHYLMYYTPNDPRGRAGFWNDIGEGDNGGCSCGNCIDGWHPISTICEWDQPQQPCKADFNDDGKVDHADLSLFSFAMGELDCTLWPDLCDCDIEGDDNDIDGADLKVLASEFGRTDCP